MSRKLNFGTGLFIGTLLLLGITIFLNRTISNLSLGRWDLTEDKIYTVSEGAKNILGMLDVPVQVTYYVTPKDQMPAGLKTLQQEVSDKLDELSIASGGRLEYKIVDPKESEDLEQALIDKGVRPFQVQSVDRDEIGIKLVYSSLGIAYKDKADAILPQVLPESLNNFEYELLSNVLRLTREDPPAVAVYSTVEPIDPQMMQLYMQMGQQPPQPESAFGMVREVLQSETYNVREVQLTEESTIPDDAATLLVLAPRELDERQQYEIARFLRQGGNVLIAAQAMSYDYNPATRGGFDINASPSPLPVNELLERYGIRIDDRALMDEQMATLAIPRPASIGGMRLQVQEPVQSPIQIRVMGDGLVRDTPLTAGVPEVLYLWGTQLILDDEALAASDLTVNPVLHGGPNSWVVDKEAGPLTESDTDPEQNEMIERPLLAVLVEGQFPDPWEGREVPEWASAEADTTAAGAEDSPEEAIEPAPGRLLVFGCAKLFEDMLLSQQGHGLLMLNAVDAMTLGDDLITIRSKVYDRRTIGEVSDGKRLGFRVVNTAVVPAIVIIFGLGRMVIRRREADEYASRIEARSGRSGGNQG